MESFAALVPDHHACKLLIYNDNQVVAAVLHAMVSANLAMVVELLKLRALLNGLCVTIHTH